MGRVVVVGAVNMDFIGRAARLPVRSETLIGTDFDIVPGGKGANQAVASRRSGADTTFVGSVGNDHSGRELITFLGDEGLDLRLVEHDTLATGAAVILVGGAGENVILMIPGANAATSAGHVERVDLVESDVVLIQAEISTEANYAALCRARRAGCRTVVNLSPFDESLLRLLAPSDYLVVNELELAQMEGRADFSGTVEESYELLRGIKGFANIIVTVGRDGVVAALSGRRLRLEGHVVPVIDTTGAGDCFCGCFAAQLAAGAALDEAIAYANAAAALSVGGVGAAASMPVRHTVTAFLGMRSQA
jgi:ribokinase